MIKQVGSARYAHKSNVDELVNKSFSNNDEKLKFYTFLQIVNQTSIEFDIIKIDKYNVTLISSPDWNTANEPIVGMCYRWKKEDWFYGYKSPIVRSNFKQIYHNKWMFVASNYTGFNIEQAKERSKLWNSLPDIKEVKNKIGYKDFWEQYLKKYRISL